MFSTNTNKIKYKMIMLNNDTVGKDGKKVINEKVLSKILETVQIDSVYDLKFLVKIDNYNIDCTIEKLSLNNLVRVCINGIFSTSQLTYSTDDTIDGVVQSITDIVSELFKKLYKTEVDTIDFEMKLTKLLQTTVSRLIKSIVNIVQDSIDVETSIMFSLPYLAMLL